MQLTALRRDERGSVLVTAILVMVVMLSLGLALMSLNDVQARQSGTERTRDQAFNLAESVLTSEAYALSHSWPSTGAAAPSATGSTGTAAPCVGAGFGAAIGATAPAGSAPARIQPNLSASYTDAAYTGATWQVNVCDDAVVAAGVTPVWSATDVLSSTNPNYDANANNRMWVRAQGTVHGVTRVVVGLVDIGTTAPLPPSFALVNGTMSVNMSMVAGGAPSNTVLTSLTNLLLGTSDPLVVGRIGIRCGIYDVNLITACLGGNGLASAGTLLGSTTVSNQYSQFPTDTAVSPETISQFRSQAIATGTYVATTTGKTSATDAALPACTVPSGLTSSKIWFIEQVGTGDQYCKIPANLSTAPAMIVVGSGRLVIRGGNSQTAPQTLNTVVYGLNLQRPNPDSVAGHAEIIRIDQNARVVGAVFVDGKSGQVGLYPTVDCGLLNLGCVLSALGLAQLLGLQIGQQGPMITYDAAIVGKLKVYTTSGVVQGTFRAL
jgi:Tfp pilus assembly protein PilX